MAIQKLFSVTTKNQLQIVTLLMKGNQRLVLLLFLTYRVLRINLFYNRWSLYSKTWLLPYFRDLTHSQLAEIFLHLSVDKLRAGCIAQEASDQLKIEVLTCPHDTPAICKRFSTSVSKDQFWPGYTLMFFGDVILNVTFPHQRVLELL